MAVSAQATGALDYRQITNKDPKSLLKEHLVHSQLEIDKEIDYKTVKALYMICLNIGKGDIFYEQNVKHEKDLFFELILPWQYRGYKQATAGQKTAIEKFIESNNELQNTLGKT